MKDFIINMGLVAFYLATVFTTVFLIVAGG